ncbi:MAG: anhydro-N-acetylmuramic acid kinase [Pseudomonadota bacterium]
MGKIKRAIGLMSGTSMDGIDVAAIETDGLSYVQRVGFEGYSYCADFRKKLLKAVEDAQNMKDRHVRPGCLASVETELTRRHAEIVQSFLPTIGWQADTTDVVGFHGQTLLHRPEAGLTVQIGDGQALADATEIPVVYDLRAADVAVGGQGAPLAPVFHRALASGLKQSSVAVVNIGGVANITWIGDRDELISFDTGPGNALIDDWVAGQTSANCDLDGSLAASGQVDRKVVDSFLAHPFFSLVPPKSLDRNAWVVDGLESLSLADGAATLTACTAESIARAGRLLAKPPETWIVCGGGRKNTTLMTMLADAVDGEVKSAEDVGWNGDSVEAEAWAYLAVRSIAGLPITFPGTTGVDAPKHGGILTRPGRV